MPGGIIPIVSGVPAVSVGGMVLAVPGCVVPIVSGVPAVSGEVLYVCCAYYVWCGERQKYQHLNF